MKPFYAQNLDNVLSNKTAASHILGKLSGKGEDLARENLLREFKKLHYAQRALTEPELNEAFHVDKSDQQIYLDAMEIKAHRNKTKMDSDGLIFARQLTQIDPRYMEAKHQPLGKWRELFPIQTFEQGRERIAYRQFDFSGNVKDQAPGDNSINWVNATGTEYENKVYSYSSGYWYTYLELRRAAISNTPLDHSKLRALKLSFETKAQQVMFYGLPEKNIEGFINHTNVPDLQAGAPASDEVNGSRTFAGGDKTPSEIIADLTGMVAKIISDNKSAFGETGFIICLPAEQFLHIYKTPRSENSDTSIANWILQNYPFISSFQMVHELAGQGQNSTDLAIAYRKDPLTIEAQIADSVIYHPPQFHDLEIRFPAEMEFGGVVVRYPLGMGQLYGI